MYIRRLRWVCALTFKNMITLRSKLKKSSDAPSKKTNDDNIKPISIRDKLLIKEVSKLKIFIIPYCTTKNFIFKVQEMNQTLLSTCYVTFEDPNCLHEFKLIISPDEGFWSGGRFYFFISVPEDYNMVVSTLTYYSG